MQRIPQAMRREGIETWLLGLIAFVGLSHPRDQSARLLGLALNLYASPLLSARFLGLMRLLETFGAPLPPLEIYFFVSILRKSFHSFFFLFKYLNVPIICSYRQIYKIEFTILFILYNSSSS